MLNNIYNHSMIRKILQYIGNNPVPYTLICIGLFLQCIFSNPNANITWYETISFISGILGVFAVVLCSNRKLISYAFGIAQILTFLVIAYHDALYAKIAENVFYLITMFIGVFIWNKHYDQANKQVETKYLSPKVLTPIVITIVLLSILIGYLLSQYTNETYPYFDALTTAPAFVAQILMILRYREQWIFWLIADIGCLGLWIMINNPYMIAQYIFWIINCIYGMIMWKNH